MKILHIIAGLDVGGAELMLQRLIEADHAGGREVLVVSLTSLGPIGERLRAQRVCVHALGLSSFAQLPMALIRLIRLIKSHQPSVVQTWMYHADFLGGLAARLAGCRAIIWGVRTTDVSKGGSRATACVRWVCARLSAWLPHTIVCAAEASRRAHAALGYRASRMVVIPNGFDLGRWQVSKSDRDHLRAHCAWSAGTLVVGCLARFNAVKDIQNFVDASARVAKQRPDVRFLMVGAGMDSGNRILGAWLEATGCPERFVLLGLRADVPACLSAMDVFALSSRTEGFPNVVGEAMAMGLPCVVTDVGDAALLLGDCGVVVPPEDASALADGMLKLLALEPEQRLAMGREASARIALEFSMARCVERFDAVYKNVVMSPGN
jgi:glycosyltransferase involved in cell wall biosynthesis